MSPEIERALQVFFPFTWKRTKRLKNSNSKLVHYCSADTAVSIIKNREIWMRNASMMNDYSEVKYGLEQFFNCWNNTELRKRVQTALQILGPSCFEALCNEVEELPKFVENSVYMLCLSEQFEPEEDNQASVISCGRLSMWRAYGGQTNVALLLNTDVFFSDSTALSVYTSPVCYGDENRFVSEFQNLCKSLENETEYLIGIGKDIVVQRLVVAFLFAILSFKHPGFSEEREWRVLLFESFGNIKGVDRTVKSIGSVPQIIYTLPLLNRPEEGLTGMSVPDLFHEILVGPVSNGQVVRDAIIETLTASGFVDAHNRVRLSSIPFKR